MHGRKWFSCLVAIVALTLASAGQTQTTAKPAPAKPATKSAPKAGVFQAAVVARQPKTKK